MANWEAIRSLDEEENWVERNRVLSKSDHLEMVENAKAIVEDLVAHLPIPSSPSQPASEQGYMAEVAYSYMGEFTDQDFQYSAAQFDVDYLETISSEANSDPSELARKSLFVKFDPLVDQQLPGRRKATPPSKSKSRLIPKSEGDLLLLGTPPTSGLKREAKSNATTEYVPSILSPLGYADCSPLGARTADSHPPNQPVADIPETDSLIDVLKYSEDDLPDLLEASRKAQRDAESEMYERQIKGLREKIVNTRQQLQQNNRKKESFQARSVLQNTSNEKTEQDLANCMEKLQSHLQRERDLLMKHEEFKKDFLDLEEQLEVITRDSTSLENSFDELHQLYVKQKGVHQCLSDRNKVIQQYMAELKSWTREDGENKEEMQRELHQLEQRAEETFESMRKEHTSRMTVERTKTLKLRMQLDNLDKTYKQKAEEKQQVSQICDELMRELETMQKIG